MIKTKCIKCNRSEVYDNEVSAYLDGWYYNDGSGPGYPYNCHAVEICQHCREKELAELLKQPVEIVVTQNENN